MSDDPKDYKYSEEWSIAENPREQLLSFIDAGADGDEPVTGVMQCNVREWFDEIERLQQRLTGELIHKCFICELVDSPREGCDCVCCSIRRAEKETELLNNLVLSLNRKLVLAESRLGAVVHHWDEFGPEYGFAETIDRARGSLPAGREETRG